MVHISLTTCFCILNKNSNHPPQIIKKLPKTINGRLFRNSSNADIFHASKVEYEAVLKNTGYKNGDFKYNIVNKSNSRQNRQRNIIWLNRHLVKQCQQMLQNDS